MCLRLRPSNRRETRELTIMYICWCDQRKRLLAYVANLKTHLVRQIQVNAQCLYMYILHVHVCVHVHVLYVHVHGHGNFNTEMPKGSATQHKKTCTCTSLYIHVSSSSETPNTMQHMLSKTFIDLKPPKTLSLHLYTCRSCVYSTFYSCLASQS